MRRVRKSIAPEVFMPFVDGGVGYSFAVDWWALGITAYELLHGSSRYCDLPESAEESEVLSIIHSQQLLFSSVWSPGVEDLIRSLLTKDPSSLSDVQASLYLTDVDWDAVLQKSTPPGFISNISGLLISSDIKRRLNCDPRFELEEMILESHPLHKKKKRLAKSRNQPSNPLPTHMQSSLDSLAEDFIVFNREKMKQQQRLVSEGPAVQLTANGTTDKTTTTTTT